MPIMVDAELWRESGRIDAYGKELVRFDDRHGREFVLGPTHEETVTALVRNELRSYKQLPVNLYHIQDKFRDEFRPRFGLMRGREFIMKDAYSFSATQESLQEEYDKMKQAYANICERCYIKALPLLPTPVRSVAILPSSTWLWPRLARLRSSTATIAASLPMTRPQAPRLL